MELDKLHVSEKMNRPQVEAVQKQQNEYKYIGSLKHCPGHIMFSYNRKTGEVKRTDIGYKVSIGVDSRPLYKRELNVEPDCFYDQALNEKNFIKHLKKYGIIKS